MAAFSSVLITGANRGLGLEFVKHFLQQRHPPKHLLATCRTPQEAEELSNLAEQHPSSVHVLKFDITDTTQYDRIVGEVDAIVGSNGLNLLINNAGIMNKKIAKLEDQTKEELMRHFEVNTVGPVLVTKAFLPLLRRAAAGAAAGDNVKKAAVVFLSSALGCFHMQTSASNPYRYAKAALNMVAHSLAKELQPDGIFVMAVHPGHVKTDMGTSAAPIEKDVSVSGLMKIILGMEECHRGALYRFDGVKLDW